MKEPLKQEIVNEPKQIIEEKQISETVAKKPLIMPKASSFSINKNLDNSLKFEQERKLRENPIVEDLDWALFKQELDSFVNNVMKDKSNVYFLLRNSDIEPHEDNAAKIILKNVLQEKEFETIRAEITNYIREKTKCSVFRFYVELEIEQEKQRLYTSNDKFEYLSKKNPFLLQFKQEFGFDVDY